MKSLSFYEQQHLQRLFQQEGQIKYLFDDFVRRVSPLLAKWSDHGGDRIWVRNTSVENAIDKELSALYDSLLNFITDTTIQSWNRGNRKADDLVKSYIEGMSVSEALRDKMFSRNADSLNALLRRKDNSGFTISDRVWKVTGGMKENLEYYLSSGVSVGRPAVLIGQDVRQLLNEPGRRFRRVRDEKGKLVMSKPMADYHPGQGVYRSAYKNALRLTATQTNIGYRQADHDRWQKMDFVLGIEVKRSNNNHGPCKICDAMVGKYPKGFVFTGFHPFCICYAVPIMMDQEEFADFLLDERIPEEKIITSLPAGAEKFIRDNKEQLSRTKPYWYKDNFIDSNKPSFFAKVSEKKKHVKTGEEKADIHQAFTLNTDTQLKRPSFNNVQDAVDYIQSNIADTTSLTIKKSDLPILEDILSQINNRMQEFGISKFKRLGVPASKVAHASFDSNGYALNLNLSKLRNPKSIWSAEKKWRAKGVKYSAIIDEQDVVRSTIDHEIGHIVHLRYKMSLETINAFKNAGITKDGVNEINDILGYYASTVEDEYFAEAFSLFVSKDKEKLGKYTSDLMKELMAKIKAQKARNSKK